MIVIGGASCVGETYKKLSLRLQSEYLKNRIDLYIVIGSFTMNIPNPL